MCIGLRRMMMSVKKRSQLPLHLEELSSRQLLQRSALPIRLEYLGGMLLVAIACSAALLDGRPALAITQLLLMKSRVTAAREVVVSDQQSHTMPAGAALVWRSDGYVLLESAQSRRIVQSQELVKPIPPRELLLLFAILSGCEAVQVTKGDQLPRIVGVWAHDRRVHGLYNINRREKKCKNLVRIYIENY